MTAWADMKIQVERTVTEFADITISIDMDEYTEWLGGKVPTGGLLAEFIKAHRDYPINVPLDGADWREHDVEIEVSA